MRNGNLSQPPPTVMTRKLEHILAGLTTTTEMLAVQCFPGRRLMDKMPSTESWSTLEFQSSTREKRITPYRMQTRQSCGFPSSPLLSCQKKSEGFPPEREEEDCTRNG